jgi:hypothetical protein
MRIADISAGRARAMLAGVVEGGETVSAKTEARRPPRNKIMNTGMTRRYWSDDSIIFGFLSVFDGDTSTSRADNEEQFTTKI